MNHDQQPPLWFQHPYLTCLYVLGGRIADVLLRVVAGGNLIPHGYGKIVSEQSVAGFSGFVAQLGFPMPLFFAWVATLTELVGGFLIVVGLLTRPVAAAAIILMLVIVFGVHWENGFSNRQGGYEYPLMWLIVLLVVFFKGSGHYSLDRLLFNKQF